MIPSPSEKGSSEPLTHKHRPHEEDVFRCERHVKNLVLKSAATCSSVAADSSTKTAD